MKIIVGNDHAATDMKFMVLEYLKELGHEVVNIGVDTQESVDYPEYGKKVAQEVVDGNYDFGIILCGTGIGISISANRIKGSRTALCTNSTMAELTRKHNNANILALGARIIGDETAKSIIHAFLNTEFEGGRHQRRIDKIED